MSLDHKKPITREEYKDLERWAGAAETIDELRSVVHRLVLAVGYEVNFNLDTDEYE